MYLRRTITTIIKWIPVILILCFILQAMIPSSADSPATTDLRFNMSYVYFGSSGSYIQHVDRTNNSLDEISPNYFNLNKDGSLALTQAVDKAFIEEMHRQGISVVPFLSNHWDRELGQAALVKREELAGQIAQAINRYDLDGINVDLENLTHNERDQYTDFIRILKEKLGDEKTIAVAVAANPFGITTGWNGSYDYKSLGSYSDYLMIMAYDEHYRGSEPGTIASFKLAEKSIQYAIDKVPKDKIVLGIPFYGRIWKNGAGFPQGEGIGNMEVHELIERYDGSVTFDNKTSTPFATITVKQKDEMPKVGGKQISAGTYTIWFEDERSLKQKLQLIEKYDIKGSGSWSLGQETIDTWDYYKLWLNGCHFNDVGKHWARDYILKAYKKKWIIGVSQNLFYPDRTLTRAEAATMLVRLLELSLIPDKNSVFADISGHWAQDEINTARLHNIVNGVSDDRFEPDAPITREQMAVMLNNVLKAYSIKGEGKPAVFTDVGVVSNPWSWEAIGQISKLGIVTGFSDGSYRPKQQLSRSQMTVMISELARVLSNESVNSSL
jgi:spore germination protein YaaH